jgi:hypothetical protein
MVERIRALDGALELATWIALLNIAVLVAVIVAVAIRQARPSIPWAGAFLIAVICAYVRLAYRIVTDSSTTYAGALVHVGVAVTGFGMLVSVLQSKREDGS